METVNFYTLDEAAEKLGVNRENLRKLVAKGELNGHKRFGRWYIFHDDLSKYIREGRPSNR